MKCLISIILVFLLNRSLVATAFESPFAISVSPSTIYASRYNASNSIEILRHPTPEDFQESYKSVVLNFGVAISRQRDLTKERVIINNTLKPAIEAWESELGLQKLPEIKSFFISSVFDYLFREASAELVFPPYTEERSVKDGPARQAAYQGYGFLECKNLGRRIEECNEDGPTNLSLTLEYEEEYLYIWLQVVDFELNICPLISERFVRELGQKYRETLGAEAYDHKFRTILDEVLSGMDAQFYKREDVRAIIVSGEVPGSAGDELAQLARSVVGTDTAKVMTGFPASEVVARGAAVWARRTQITPWKFIIELGNRPSPLEHDEL